MTSWDILIPTIPHRHGQLCALLAEIDRQWQPGLGVLVYRDNLRRPGNASYAKWQALEEMSRAACTSFAGDDDWIAPDFVAQVMAALEPGPDYVGFAVRYTSNGQQMMPVEHSLRHTGWYESGGVLCRDIVHHNPVRRELALLATWRTDLHDADRQWADDLRATGKVRREVWIPEQMYHYQETSGSWSRWAAPPQPLPVSEIEPVPSYPWLTVHDEVIR